MLADLEKSSGITFKWYAKNYFKADLTNYHALLNDEAPANIYLFKVNNSNTRKR